MPFHCLFLFAMGRGRAVSPSHARLAASLESESHIGLVFRNVKSEDRYREFSRKLTVQQAREALDWLAVPFFRVSRGSSLVVVPNDAVLGEFFTSGECLIAARTPYGQAKAKLMPRRAVSKHTAKAPPPSKRLPPTPEGFSSSAPLSPASSDTAELAVPSRAEGDRCKLRRCLLTFEPEVGTASSSSDTSFESGPPVEFVASLIQALFEAKRENRALREEIAELRGQQPGAGS